MKQDIPRIRHDTYTYDDNELRHFIKLLSVFVLWPVFMSVCAA